MRNIMFSRYELKILRCFLWFIDQICEVDLKDAEIDETDLFIMLRNVKE